MQRLFLALGLLVVSTHGTATAAHGGDIFPETTAARHGLTRPWFSQIQMDRSRSRISSIVLHEGILYVQTDHAMLHVIDAETGQTLWAKEVGRPNHPSMTPAPGADVVAVVNGSRLYVCNRYNGDLLYEVEIEGAPGAGPCISQTRAPTFRVFVPLVTGRVLAYPLTLTEGGREAPEQGDATSSAAATPTLRMSQDFKRPISCPSEGRSLTQPLITRESPGEEYVAWTTDMGFLNVGWLDLANSDEFVLRFRLETARSISTRPAYLPPDPADQTSPGIIFGASQDGYVYAVQGRSGDTLWRFSTGEPIDESPVVVAQRLYVTTQFGGMYCLDAQTKEQIWWTPGIHQFVTASAQRLYVTDHLGRIVVLHAETGTRLDTIAAGHLPMKLVNSDTDRIYLATDTGLVQCLHEVEQVEPLHHEHWPDQPAEEQPATDDVPNELFLVPDVPFG